MSPALASTLAPALPPLALQDAARHLLWALVLVWLLLALREATGRRGPRRAWLVAAAALGALVLWPGPASPAWWLGLAFQSPSLLTGGLCALGIVHAVRGAGSPRGRTPPWAAVAWVVLGWVLLLDTLALWPAGLTPGSGGSLYALGWEPGLLWLALATGALWALCAPSPVAMIFIAVCALFAGTRAPSGNVFDALLDPWLWLLMHAVLLRSLVAAWRQRRGRSG